MGLRLPPPVGRDAHPVSEGGTGPDPVPSVPASGAAPRQGKLRMNSNIPDQPRQNEAGLNQPRRTLHAGLGPDPVPAAQVVAWDDEDEDYDY